VLLYSATLPSSKLLKQLIFLLYRHWRLAARFSALIDESGKQHSQLIRV
jgi:hypothetical protein